MLSTNLNHPRARARSGPDHSPCYGRMLLAGLLGLLAVLLTGNGYLGGERYRADLSIRFLPDKLTLVQGEGHTQPEAITIHALSEQGVALLSSPRGLVFQAAPLERLRWCLEGPGSGLQLQVLWVTLTAPVSSAVLPAEPGCHEFAMDTQENWAGTVNGLGFQLSGELTGPVVLSAVQLRPAIPTPLELAREIWRDWSKHSRWLTSEVHFVRLGSLQPLVPLTLVLIVWVLCSVLIFWLLTLRLRPRGRPLATACASFIVFAWLLIDGLWQWELARRVDESYRLLAHQPMQERLRYYDGELITLVDSIRALLPPGPQRLFILSDETHRTQKLRAHYHLLPHNVNSQDQLPPPPELARPGDYVMIFGRIDNLRYRNRRGQEALIWGADNQFELPVTPLLAEHGGLLFRVREP